jgi:trehalose 6-phosphate phosphatase
MIMKNLLLSIPKWRKRLESEPLAVFLDYDGTLSAIAPTPSEAKLPYATKAVLQSFARLKNVKVAIVSGRALSDLGGLVAVRGLSLVGSHGMEYKVAGTKTCLVSAYYLRELAGLKSVLELHLADVPGVLLEHKPFSLAIHYRQASSVSEQRIKQVVLDYCESAVNQNKIAILTGSKVIEIMPPNAMNKGRAVKRLLRIWGGKKFLPIFIGDDKTDEHAFDVLKGRGITVKVGGVDEQSSARYYLNSVADVRSFLMLVLYLRQQ